MCPASHIWQDFLSLNGGGGCAGSTAAVASCWFAVGEMRKRWANLKVPAASDPPGAALAGLKLAEIKLTVKSNITLIQVNLVKLTHHRSSI